MIGYTRVPLGNQDLPEVAGQVVDFRQEIAGITVGAVLTEITDPGYRSPTTDHRLETATDFFKACAALPAGVNGLAGLLDAFFDTLGLASDENRRGGVEDRDVALQLRSFRPLT